MNELRLKFKNENGETKRIQVLTEEFSIGRHSENDLSIADSAVSRKHLKIERFGEMFVASDTGSTLGTKINGQKLSAPVTLKNGDQIILGDSVEISVIFGEEIFDAPGETKSEIVEEIPENEVPENETSVENSVVPVNSKDGSSVPISFFIIAPILGILFLILVGGIFLVIKSGEKKEVSQGNDFIYSGNRLREKNQTEDFNAINSENDSVNISVPTNENVNTDSGNISTNEIIEANSESPVNQSIPNGTTGELAKIEANSASFLRRIAQRDPRAALTGTQQKILSGKIIQFKNSSALAANLKSARQNAAQIQSLASQKNLKPQFLTAAALAGLGNSSGNVLTQAQTMANVLDELSRNVGDEFSDDSLLVISAYEQGAAGKTLEMRNMLQGLTDKFPESSRRIRTIWFLKENGKISDSQFEFALRFLAVGTISQNPADFGVNAEAVKF
ncbi:hypothetical protein BH20ACI4_BH20ACI4_15900 [soil metagenome]